MDALPADSKPSHAAASFTPMGHTEQAGALSAADRALVALGEELRRQNYRFTTITPLSHARVNARAPQGAATLADIFGWSRAFDERDFPAAMLAEAGALEMAGAQLRSAVRFSTLDEQIFVHSAFPTEQGDAVFFGPDTYRFARVIRQSLATWERRPARIIDIGAGSGAGGLHAAASMRDAWPQVVLTDINEQALRFSRINTALNNVPNVEVVESNLYDDVSGDFDLIIANPPYLVDARERTYRHGGGEFGGTLSVQIAEQGIVRLAPGGRLLLYTGSAIVEGADPLHDALREGIARRVARFSYDEIDPDVFGEELEGPPYDRADRIAVVAVTVDV
jgi:methylase of polypeptide subunit release factors